MVVTYYLGWTYLDLQKYQKGIEVLTECVRLDPKNPLIYTAIAEGYYHQKRFKEALSYAQKGASNESEFAGCIRRHGSHLLRNEEAERGEEEFRKGFEPRAEVSLIRYNLAMTCLAMNQRDCAREQYAILKHVEPWLGTQLLDHIYSRKVIRLVK